MSGYLGYHGSLNSARSAVLRTGIGQGGRGQEMSEESRSQGHGDDVGRYVTWLISERTAEATYHNHKENMAWVATYLYVFAVFTVTYYVWNLEHLQPFYTIISLLVTSCFFLFIYTQFMRRWEAAEKIEGLTKALSGLLSTKISLDESSTKPEDVGGASYPAFVKKEIDGSKKRRRTELGKGIPFFWRLDARLKTELASYLLMAVAVIVANIVVSSK